MSTGGLTHVFADEEGPGFSYTTGIWHSLGFPEIITFQMNDGVAHSVYWDIYRDVKGGRAISTGMPVDNILSNLPVCFLPVGKLHYA